MTELLHIRSQIKHLLVQVLELKIDAERIGDEDLLFEGRLGVDSIAAIELLTAIEETFGFDFRDEDIHLDLFRSVNSLAAVVHEQLKSKKGGDPEG